MRAVWHRIDSSAQALGAGMRAGGEKRARDGDEGQAQDPYSFCSALLRQVLDLSVEATDRVFDVIQATTRAFAPAPILPLLTIPADCARTAVLGGIRSLGRLVR